LCQVTARYIEPVQELLKKLIVHRKWKGVPWERAKVRGLPKAECVC